MPEWKEHGLWDDRYGASVGMCKDCNKMGIGMQLKDDVCLQCRYAKYKKEGGNLPFRAFKG